MQDFPDKSPPAFLRPFGSKRQSRAIAVPRWAGDSKGVISKASARGAIVDLCYTKSEWPKVAAEVLLGHGQCSLQIETSERLTAEVLSPLWQGGGYKAGIEIKQAA